MDLPPPPPAIHAPVPGQAVRTASPFAMNARTITQRVHATSFDPINYLQGGYFNHFRYMHTKHHKGSKHKSHASRSNKRKAARKAKHRR